MEKMLIHVINDAGGGGAEKLLLECSKIWKRHIRQEIIFLSEKGFWLDEFQNTTNTQFLNISKVNPLSWIRAGYRLRKTVKHSNCIVQSWLYNANLFTSISLFGLSKQPIFWSIHASDFSKNNLGGVSRTSFFISRILTQFKILDPTIIFCSEQSKRFHHKIGFGTNNQCIVIDNGIQFPDVNIHFNNNKYVLNLVSVTRFSKQKDLDTLFRGYKLFKTQNKNLKTYLYLFGTDLDESNKDLIQLIKKNQLEINNIKLCGFTKNIIEKLKIMDCFVLTSKFGEAFPLSILEALSIGLPVVVSDLESLLSLQKNLQIPPDTMMRFFHAGSPESFAKTIKQFINRPPNNDIRIATSELIKSTYGVQKCAKEYLTTWNISIEDQ